ncbi:MAG: glycerophosphodiester phosphodiesterase [Actinomycetota bacterium]
MAFAHRGGTDGAPENTLAAFEHAWELGYRYLETDVHLTRDGELVAFHDTDLARTCGVDAAIGDLTIDELRDIRVGGEHPIPLMTELFERFPAAHFNIDAKSDTTVTPLCDLVRRARAVDRVCLASFSQRRVDRMRSILGPGLMTNLGSIGVAQLRVFGRTFRRGHQSAQVPVRHGRIPIADARFVRAAKHLGIPVHVWTIDDPVEMGRLLDLGVGGIMTDVTAALRQVFVERDLWPT